MRVARHEKRVIARFKLVPLYAVAVSVGIVVTCHIPYFKRKCNGVAFPGLNSICFGIVAQNCVRLFNSSRGIRRGIIQFNHVFARIIANVCNLYFKLYFTVGL